ncbi:MAG: hypothetical protein AB7Q42_17820 [Acidimicrobiia bacterium]
MMKKVAGALLGFGLVLGVASCGVDKEGTAENLIASLEESNGTDLTDEQKDCLTDVVKDYSDEDLRALDDSSASAELIEEFTGLAFDCLVTLGS